MRGRWPLRFPRAASQDRRRRTTAAPVPDQLAPGLVERAERSTLVLHIGLHKTASSYLQGLLAARREDLLDDGILYPTTGIVDKASTGTREGAGSGQALFSRRRHPEALQAQLLAELPENVSTVLISSEEFSRAGSTPSPERLLSRFDAFGTVKVVLVLRRQDDWIESYYKQVVDQYKNFETRPFERYLRETGLSLLDFYSRFTPWRNVVGPENFHVLSYDDLPDAVAICRRLLEIAGLHDRSLEELPTTSVPRYDSVRPIDTVGLRILNSHRLEDRDTRNRIARSIYEAAPDGDIELMSAHLREEIQAVCRPINERIEAEWCDEAMPGLRFGEARGAASVAPPTGPEVVAYVDRVLSLCDTGRGTPRSTSDRGGGRA